MTKPIFQQGVESWRIGGKAWSLGVFIAAISVSASCGSATRNTPLPAPARSMPRLQATSHERHRPRHQGGADLSTGVYIREDDDLVVNTPMPIVLRRTYNSGDGHSRQFGADATHPGEWLLYGDGDPRVPWADLILANGGRIHFERISAGETQDGAVLRHDSTPTEFAGALLVWTGSRWEIRLRDGSVASFLDCQGPTQICSLVERRDPDGHRISYERDAAGLLLKMESDGQNIAFDYDDHKRIVRAHDTSGGEVRYTYDDRSRLIRVEGAGGLVREYEYDDRDGLVGVREPGRILRNWFDDDGRWVRQVLKDSDEDDHPYVAAARYLVENGSIVASAFEEGGGLEVRRYDTHHYVVSETLQAEGPAPIVFAYTLDPVTAAVTAAQMSCRGVAGPIARTLDAASARDDSAKAALIRELCTRP